MAKADYKKIQTLGKGAFGKALLVEGRDGVRYVMKVMSLGRGQGQSTFDECNAEAEILKSLEHPNIVGYRASFVEEGDFCLVMEWADRGDLGKVIEKRKANREFFSVEEVYDILTQLFLAIEACHNSRLLHRDLKAENVFLSADSRHASGYVVKLGDFGIARRLEDEAQVAQTFCGTLPFMSPELAAGKPYNNKTDIWSAGIVAYNLITFADAFPYRGNRQEMLRRLVLGQYEPLPRSVDYSLRELISRMLTMNPVDRWSIRQVLGYGPIRDMLQKMPTGLPHEAAGPAAPLVDVAIMKGGVRHTTVKEEEKPKEVAKGGAAVAFAKGGQTIVVDPREQWRRKEFAGFAKQLLRLKGQSVDLDRPDLGFDGTQIETISAEVAQGVEGFLQRVQARFGINLMSVPDVFAKAKPVFVKGGSAV